MGKRKELILKEYSGQGTNVHITVRKDGSSYATFESTPGFGYPCLEKAELKKLIAQMEALEA